MTEFVGVRQVPAVPSEKEVALVVRRQCQMQRIARRVGRHDMVIDIRLYYFSNAPLNR